MDALHLRRLAEDELAQRSAADEGAAEHSPMLYELRLSEIMLRLRAEQVARLTSDLSGADQEIARLRGEVDVVRQAAARAKNTTAEIEKVLTRAQEAVEDIADAPPEWRQPLLDDLRRIVEIAATLTARLRYTPGGAAISTPPPALAGVGNARFNTASATTSGSRLRTDLLDEPDWLVANGK